MKGLREMLAAFGVQRPMIVTGKNVSASAAYNNMLSIVDGFAVTVFDGVKAHVPKDSVEAGVAAAQSFPIDALVSIGGGSAIDTAKAIAMVLAEGDGYATLEQRLTSKGEIVEPIMRQKKLLHIAVPTTLSGAECTGTAGITMPDGNKHLFSSPSLAPQCIVYDPLMTTATPDELWFGTALRALDHAIERSYSLATNPLNDALCLHAIRLIFSWLPKNLAHRNDLESRLMLMHAAFLSMAGPSTTCLSHAIGHQLGPRYTNPLFDSTAVTQPAIMAFNRPFCLPQQRAMAIAMGLPVHNLSDEDAAVFAENAVRRLIERITAAGIQIPTRMRDTGIAESSIVQVANAILRSPRLKANPRPIRNLEQVTTLLQQMW